MAHLLYKQLYMIEILFDKISIYVRDDDHDQDTNKGFIIKMKFGPKDDVNFKENHLAEVTRKDAVVACDDQQFDKKWNRNLRVGKSYLFSGYPDILNNTLGQFPIDVTVWTDKENEVTELIGYGSGKWDPRFYDYLRENESPKRLHEPFALKQTITLWHENMAGRAGELDVILRISALGQSITTEFQQNPDIAPFVFRTDKVPTMFVCERTKGDDINFCMVGIVYETITLEDPGVIDNMHKKIEICTELDSCKPDDGGGRKVPVMYPIKKIRMKDIVGPCGNTNCALTHRIKTYLRSLDHYRQASKGQKFPDKNAKGHREHICGECGCKEDRWHRETCPENDKKPTCTGCGGIAQSGETCEDRIKRINAKTNLEKDNKNKGKETKEPKKVTKAHYLTSITPDPEQKQSIFGQNFHIYPCNIQYQDINTSMPPIKYCTCGQNTEVNQLLDKLSGSRSMANVDMLCYQAEVKADSKTTAKFCTDMPEEKDKECKCNPVIPTPPCKTFDCECLLKAKERITRRIHKPYCPAYIHKSTCPVQRMNDEENPDALPPVEDDDVEKLPYGLPPVSVGPCSVLGRPCSVPDGYARMYRTAALPNEPVSYSNAGKVCCSAEFNRIKKAISEYMKAHEKEDDYRCLNKFNWDTSKRCCDKEQRLLGLIGKSCCGSHGLDKNKNATAPSQKKNVDGKLTLKE
ncbi:hypothetical protein O0L34_g1043 [Tuta absoluta]|nr:hypothetical protein O0L34_g1043 [Tuta absoluta]